MLRRKAKSQNHKGLPTKMISIHHSFHYYLLSFPPLFLLLFTLCTLLISVPPPIQELPWQLRCSRIHLQCRRPCFNSWVRKICWRRERLPTPVFLGFPGGSAGKESTCNVGDLGSIPGLGRYPREGNSYSLQHPGLENPMGCIVHRVVKSRTRLRDFHFHPPTVRPLCRNLIRCT